MSPSASELQGRFIWHDVVTSDTSATMEFYGSLFGWTTEATDSDLGYSVFKMGEAGIGGMMKAPPGQEVPPHWMSYIHADDVDATVEKATALGATTLVPPEDIAGVGRFGVIMDPQGGCVSLMKFLFELPPHDPAPPQGHFCWVELLSKDAEASEKFYTQLIGWNVEKHEMGEYGTYRLLTRDKIQDGGIMQMPPEAQAPTNWLPYVAVDDVDAMVEKLKSLDGSVHMPPMDIPEVGRFSVVADPLGATFAMFTSAPKA